MYKIYIYRNDINSKVYIGQTSKTLEERARNGLGYQGCTYFYNAIEKYGWSKFHGAILEDNLTAEQANDREQFWIKYFKSNDPKFGYNICSGGNNLIGIHRGKSKRVFCITTQQWFNSLSDAAEWAGLARSQGGNIGLAASGKRMTAGEHPITHKPLQWSYTEKMQQIQNIQSTRAQRVQDITTGIIYSSLKEAMKLAHISQDALIKGCTTGQSVGRAKHQWKYIDN